MVNTLCDFCLKEISNPICGHCYSTHFMAWTIRNSISDDKQKNMISTIRKFLIIQTDHVDECIICHKGNVNVCYYCFFSRAHKIVKSQVKEKKGFEPFESVFNYKDYEEDETSLL